ncbi:MAG: TorF family putative porin [Planctomycetota bacterium]
MTKESKLTGLCLVGGLAAAALTTSSVAQDAPPAVNNGLLTWSAGADVVSTYIFRGFEQEDSGLIVQPYVEVGAPLGDTGLDFTLGTWSSIHSEGTGATGDPSNWYEADLYASLGYSINDQFAVTAGFTGFYYPNGFSQDIEEITFQLDYDDSEALGDFAFAPYALFAFETRDDNGTEDIYLELGGEFSAFFIESEDLPVELSFPFALGLSIDDYYLNDDDGDNEFFGFLKVGVAASMPLDFIPADYGVWSASAGLDFYFVNGDVDLMEGNDFGIAALFGVAMEY